MTAVEVDGREERLQGIGQDGTALLSPAAKFTRSQPKIISEAQFTCNFGERVPLHQSGTQPAQLAFVGLGETAEQSLGNNGTEYGVPEELEPFVVVVPGTAVGKRRRDYAFIGEFVADQAT